VPLSVTVLRGQAGEKSGAGSALRGSGKGTDSSAVCPVRRPQPLS